MNALFENREGALAAAEKLKVFAQPQRLMILSRLLRGESNVSDIAAATRIGQPALSQQLAELRKADLVRTRKEARQVWYALADDGVALCVRSMEAIFGGAGNGAEIALPTPAAPPDRSPPEGVAGFARIIARDGR